MYVLALLKKIDYTREEIKKMDADKIHKLFSSIIQDEKNIYFKCNGITGDSYISGFYFDTIDFHDNMVELIYERFGCYEDIHVLLTEEEFLMKILNCFSIELRKD